MSSKQIYQEKTKMIKVNEHTHRMLKTYAGYMGVSMRDVADTCLQEMLGTEMEKERITGIWQKEENNAT